MAKKQAGAKPATMKDLGEFTEQVILPGVERIIEDNVRPIVVDAIRPLKEEMRKGFFRKIHQTVGDHLLANHLRISSNCFL